MDIARRLRAGARWLGIAKVVTQLYTWVMTVMVMRLLMPEDYALMAMAGVFLSFIAQFEELGVRVKLVQMKELTLEYARSVFGLVLVTNFVLVACLMIGAPFIADFFKQERLVPVIFILSLSMLIGVLGSIPDAMIKRNLDFRSLALVDVVRVVVTSTSTFVFARAGFGVWSLVWSSLIGSVVGTLGLLIASPFRALPSFDFKGMGETLQFGGIVMLQRLVWWAYSGLDSILIGRFYPAHALGIYGTASNLATLPLSKIGSILNVLSFTGFSRVGNDRELFRRHMISAVRLVSLVMFPAFFGIAAISDEIAPALLGERWTEVGTVIGILALSAPARCISSVMTESLNSLGKPMECLRCLSVTAVLYAAGILAGMPFGLSAIALGVLVSSVIASLYNARRVSAEVGLPLIDIFHNIWKPASASLGMLLFLTGARHLIALPPMILLVLSVAVGAAVYALFVFAIDREGWRSLKSLAFGR